MHDEPIQSDGENKALQKLSLTRLILPIALGLTAVGWLFWSQFDPAEFAKINWSGRTFGWIALALIFLIIRHLCYSARMRLLSGNQFSWRKAIELIIIWEFSAQLTPTSKGGPFVMLFVLDREKLPPARTASMILYTLVCDSLFFVLLYPLFFLIYGTEIIAPARLDPTAVNGWQVAFFIAYSIMICYGGLFFFLLFVRPKAAAWVFGLIGKLPFLKKKQENLTRFAQNFILAAEEMRGRGKRFHLGVVASSVGAWTFKFLLINALILAFVPEIPLDGSTQLFIFGRLAAMFTISAFFVTPGGSGLVEMTFGRLLSDVIPTGIAPVVALVWRLMAYYGYLFVGGIVVPNWISRKISQHISP